MTSFLRRGRPQAANDNHASENAAAFAERGEKVKRLRADGKTFREIGEALGLSEWSAWTAINHHSSEGKFLVTPPKRPPLAANDNKVIRRIANNGGCSTTSGMVSVSLPRIATLEKVAA